MKVNSFFFCFFFQILNEVLNKNTKFGRFSQYASNFVFQSRRFVFLSLHTCCVFEIWSFDPFFLFSRLTFNNKIAYCIFWIFAVGSTVCFLSSLFIFFSSYFFHFLSFHLFFIWFHRTFVTYSVAFHRIYIWTASMHLFVHKFEALYALCVRNVTYSNFSDFILPLKNIEEVHAWANIVCDDIHNTIRSEK